MALMPDLADLWNGQHDINKESIFSIYATGSFFKYKNIYGITDWDRILPTDIYFGYTRWLGEPAIKFYNSFPNNYRKDITYLRRRIYIYKPDCIVDSLNPTYTYCPPAETLEYRLDSINNCTAMYFRKYDIEFNLSDSVLANYIPSNEYQNEFKVIYLFRYAHTLLTYAEAKARTGNLDALAFEAVNQVRRRANKVDLFSPSVYDIKEDISPEQFADSVVWERAWEFCAEPESRWFDLLRLEMVKNLGSIRSGSQGPVYPLNMLSTYFFPIPQEDQQLNLNLQ
jgi:hypothetical protein